MSHHIRIAEPGLEPRTVKLTHSVELGRQVDGIVLVDPTVSRRHVLLEVTGGGLVAVDLGSTYGTYLNSARLEGPALVQPGDRLAVGDTRIDYLGPVADLGDTASPPAPPPAPGAPSPTSPPPPAPPAPQAGAPIAAVPPPPATGAAPPATPLAPASPFASAGAETGADADSGAHGAPPSPAVVAPMPATGAAPPGNTPALAPRPLLDELASIDAGGAAVVRYRPATPGERAAKAMATRAQRARRRLAGLGSEPWGVVPQICLVDPFPDPDDPASMVTTGTIVDADRNEIWMVVTAESPPEDPERPLALLFGATLPAAHDLEPLLEGYGLWLAKAGRVDEELRAFDLPPLVMAEGELRAAMGLSFVMFLLERENEDALRRLFGTAQAGRVDQAMQEIYGLGATPLEQAWRERVASGAPKVKTGQFLRLSLRYLRPYRLRQAEVFLYMLFALAFTMAFPFVTRKLFDEALPSGEFSQVLSLLVALGVAFAISLVAGLRQAYASAWISGAVVRDLRGSMFSKLQTLSTGWFQRHQQGDVLTRLFTDVAVVEQGLTQTLREGLFQTLSLVVSSIVMLTISLPLGIIVLAGVPLVAVVYRTMANGAQKRGLAVQEDTGALMGVAAENYSAEPVVKLFALQHRERERFGRLSERLFRSERRLNLFGGLFGLSVNMIVTVLRLVVLGYGAWLIVDGSFTLGGLVAFLGIMGEVLSPVTVLTSVGQIVQAATGALFRINEVLEEEPELVEAEGATELPPLSREIQLVDVDFSYSTERQVLDGVHAVIPAGRRIGFVGPSGSGKSTIMQLLMRLYDPDDGAILFDGYDLRTVSASSVRGQIGVVFQDNFLFDTTVRENIAMGKAGATDAEIEAAARAAEVHEFIAQLPRGYDTVVGERGGMLSGGQRQRIAIARALVRNPRILLLDEATSALDPKTERAIIATLNQISQGRTTIAITHRLTSVTDYDHLFVIVEGRILESGTHESLVAAGGVYARLWSEQTGHLVAHEPPFDPLPALARIPLFAGLDRETLEWIAARLVAADLAPGEIVADGEGRLCIIARGRARVLTPALGGGTTISAELGVGDVFGLGALLGGGEASRLEAVEVTRLLVLGDDVISGLAASVPSVGHALAGDSGGVAPRGGQRLARMTIGMGGLQPPIPAAGMVAGAAPGAVGHDVPRMTGTFPRVEP